MSTSVRLFKGLPVHDATSGTTITIRERDLAGGYTRLSDRCAVHHAACRDLHCKPSDVRVHATKLYLRARGGKHWIRYQMQQALVVQVVVHDQGGIMREGVYKLRVPAPSAKLDKTRERSAARSGRPRGPRTARHVTSERTRPAYTGRE